MVVAAQIVDTEGNTLPIPMLANTYSRRTSVWINGVVIEFFIDEFSGCVESSVTATQSSKVAGMALFLALLLLRRRRRD